MKKMISERFSWFGAAFFALICFRDSHGSLGYLEAPDQPADAQSALIRAALGDSADESPGQLYQCSLMYEQGRGAPQSYLQAWSLLKRAQKYIDPKNYSHYPSLLVKLGHIYAGRGDLGYYEPTGPAVKVNHRQAFKAYQKARGHPIALYYSGICFEYGYGVAEDRAAAQKYYAQAAAKGYAPASCRLARLSFNDLGLEGVDHYRIVEYLSQAADAGCPTALFELGRAYLQEAKRAWYLRIKNGRQDYDHAYRYFARCAERYDHPLSYYYLGSMYDYGLGLEKSAQVALEYYCDAAGFEYRDLLRKYNELFHVDYECLACLSFVYDVGNTRRQKGANNNTLDDNFPKIIVRGLRGCDDAAVARAGAIVKIIANFKKQIDGGGEATEADVMFAILHYHGTLLAWSAPQARERFRQIALRRTAERFAETN